MHDNSIAIHMKRLGLAALSHATWHATTMSFENPYWPELSVLQAAHAAEILIKARIAEKDPGLIFKKAPMPLSAPMASKDALGSAKTYQYYELPDILKRETGVKILDLEMYHSFGRIRNQIQHLLPPESIDFRIEAISFIFKIVDPLIQECWGIYAIDFNEEPDTLAYVVEYLIENEVVFGISSDLLQDKEVVLEWQQASKEYQRIMNARILSTQS